VFTGLQPATSPFRRHRAVAASLVAHLALLAVIVFHTPRVINLSPAWLAFGDGSHSYKLIYTAPEPNSDTPPDAAKLLLPNHKPHPTPPPKAQPKPAPEPPQFTANAEPGDRDSHAGSPLGTMIDGPIEGHEVHVAYPTVYPNPPVDRDSLPRDLVGDVVIEVTIDSQGNVVETRIVQAIGHGIDEKIESTLRHWHYQPATLDGSPVASRHDVHFHFPS
jgi:protein TonB